MDITERLLEVPTMGHDAGCVMEAAEEIKRLRAAIVWALGAGDEFKPQGTMDGKYWWRGELASRAGLQWNGDKYVTAPPRNGPACNLLRPWEEVAGSENLPEVTTCTKSQTPIDWGRVEQAEALGVAVHLTPAIDDGCYHDWENGEDGNPERCSKCGLSFMRFIHSCCP
jgi:hypothetical protein